MCTWPITTGTIGVTVQGMKPELPSCSVLRCDRVAGAVVDGSLLCGEHAVEAMQRRKLRANRDLRPES